MDVPTTPVLCGVKVDQTVFPFLVGNLICQLKYIIDQKYAKGNNFDLEISYFKVFSEQMKVVESNQIYLKYMLEQNMKIVLQLSEKQQHDLGEMRFILLMVNRLFQLSLCSNTISLYKQCLQALRSTHTEYVMNA